MAEPLGSAQELESMTEDAAAREKSPLDIKTVGDIVGRALDQIDEEFGKKVDRFIYFFKRHDLSFAGVVSGDDTLYVIGVILLGDSEEIPEERLSAAFARASDLRSAAKQRDFSTNIVLIVMVITDLAGVKYIRLEGKLRERFSLRSQEEVRIMQSNLLRAKVDESEGNGSKG